MIPPPSPNKLFMPAHGPCAIEHPRIKAGQLELNDSLQVVIVQRRHSVKNAVVYKTIPIICVIFLR